MQITTPSGFSGVVRKLRGGEINILQDRKAARTGKSVDEVLTRCWVETIDPGPYPFDGPPDFGKVLQADRFHALVAIRVETYGPEFHFKVRCGESSPRGACGEQFEWTIDLLEDLQLYDLPEESVAKIKEGNNRFETELIDDDGNPRIVTFKLPVGADEVRLMKKQRKRKREGNRGGYDTSVTDSIADRIISISDVPTREIGDFLEDLGFDRQMDLLDAMDLHNGGFETKIGVECTECGNIFDIDLPFGGEEFWTPRKRSTSNASPKRKERRARTMAENG